MTEEKGKVKSKVFDSYMKGNCCYCPFRGQTSRIYLRQTAVNST